MRTAGVTPAWPATTVPRAAAQAVGIGALVTLAWFAATWFISFDLSDEGFLWYGAQRTLHGEMPLRDFSAYDIGRYFYTAAVFRLTGSEGILPLRSGAYALMLPVCAIAAYLVSHNSARAPAARFVHALAAACVAVLWIWPYFKVFDFLASSLLMLAICHLLREPGARNWFLLGCATGLAAVIGRNHGLYGLAASLLAAVVLRTWAGPVAAPRASAAGPLAWLAGMALGFSPMLVALATVDGFFATVVAGVRALIAKGETNIGLPVPWPWQVDLRRLGFMTSIAPAVTGLGFVLLLALPVGAAALVLRERSAGVAMRRRYAPFLACACVALPYTHYAFSRADMTHLALAMLPASLALLTLPHGDPRQHALRLAAVAAATVAALAPTPWLGYHINPTLAWETIEVAGTALRVSRQDAVMFRRADAALNAYLPPGRSFAALPDMPGLHAARSMRVPTHTIYVLWPANEERERQELRRLQEAQPAVVLLSAQGQDSRGFSRLRPLLYRWIRENYEAVPVPDVSPLPSTLEVYVKR